MNAQSSRTGVPAYDPVFSGIQDARLGIDDFLLCRCSDPHKRDCAYHRAYDAERRRMEARTREAIRELWSGYEKPGMFRTWPEALKALAGYVAFGILVGVPAAFLLLRALGILP